MVPQIGRFSAQPRLEDLRDLTLEDVDAEAIKRCRPEHCGLKLQPGEISRLQTAIESGARNWKGPLNDEFRRVVLERATRYLLHGAETTQAQFSTLLQHSSYVQGRMPQLAMYLDRYPAMQLTGAESFLYWSKETYAWKPMITVTHVTIARGDGERGAPEVLVASRDIFSTRYTSGSFTLALLFRDSASSSQRYLVYINRTWVDAVRALWRPFVEYRLKSQARKVFAATRDRIEGYGSAASLPK